MNQQGKLFNTTTGVRPVETIVPGKAILSGEHSVVYGAPAIAVAVNKYARFKIQPCDLINSQEVFLQLPDIQYKQKKSITDIRLMRETLDKAFSECGTLSCVNDFTTDAGALYFYAIGKVIDQFNIDFKGCSIQLVSDIPPGAGMGSSAATLISLILALCKYFCIQTTRETIIKLAAYSERLQHSCISQIDTTVVAHGGIVRFYEGISRSINTNMSGKWYLIHTGKPSSTTGDCVRAVRNKFDKSTIWSEFTEVTNELEQAICTNDIIASGKSLLRNQKLLSIIGVVPEKVQHFCHRLNLDYGIIAKISGAGSVSGHNAGLLVALAGPDGVDANQLQVICRKHDYICQPLIPDRIGARCND